MNDCSFYFEHARGRTFLSREIPSQPHFNRFICLHRPEVCCCGPMECTVIDIQRTMEFLSPTPLFSSEGCDLPSRGDADSTLITKLDIDGWLGVTAVPFMAWGQGSYFRPVSYWYLQACVNRRRRRQKKILFHSNMHLWMNYWKKAVFPWILICPPWIYIQMWFGSLWRTGRGNMWTETCQPYSHYAALLATGYEGLGLICRSIDDAEELQNGSPFRPRLF